MRFYVNKLCSATRWTTLYNDESFKTTSYHVIRILWYFIYYKYIFGNYETFITRNIRKSHFFKQS